MQIAQKVLLRAISHQFHPRDLRNGPFVLRLTDLHHGNIFVDDMWNVTYIIDLEWMCSLPMDMLSAPYWFTGCGIDELHGEKLIKYDRVHQEHMHIFREEEDAQRSEPPFRLSELIPTAWMDKRYWFYSCMTSLNGMYTIFPHIFAKFDLPDLTNDAAATLAQFWDPESTTVLAQKLTDKKEFDDTLRVMFDVPNQFHGMVVPAEKLSEGAAFSEVMGDFEGHYELWPSVLLLHLIFVAFGSFSLQRSPLFFWPTLRTT